MVFRENKGGRDVVEYLASLSLLSAQIVVIVPLLNCMLAIPGKEMNWERSALLLSLLSF